MGGRAGEIRADDVPREVTPGITPGNVTLGNVVTLGIIWNAIEFGAFESNGVNSRTSDDGKKNDSERRIVVKAKEDLPAAGVLNLRARPRVRRFTISMSGSRGGLSWNELSYGDGLSLTKSSSASRAASFWIEGFGTAAPSAVSQRVMRLGGSTVLAAHEPRVMRQTGKQGKDPSLSREVTTRCGR
jgi:hypothetical protein